MEILNSAKLQQNLMNFGLCPYDWTIELKEGDTAIVKNAEEESFQFIGKINSLDSQWEYLKLYSL